MTKTALFQAGQVVSTPGAMEAVSSLYMLECLQRHLSGDYGIICEEDKQSNAEAVKYDLRILSAYPINKDQPAENGYNTFWIITEADRSVTTFLLPEEY